MLLHATSIARPCAAECKVQSLAYRMHHACRGEDVPVNHWKLTAIGLVVVVITAIATGLVVARWYGPEISRLDVQASAPAVKRPAETQPVAQLPPRPIADWPAASPATEAPRKVASSAVPPKSVTEACNQVALRESGANTTTKDKTIDIVKDAAVGAVGGAAVGALGGAIGGGGSGAGKGAAIGGVAGAGVGTLYGIYANKQNDEKYRASYSACMKSRGYTT